MGSGEIWATFSFHSQACAVPQFLWMLPRGGFLSPGHGQVTQALLSQALSIRLLAPQPPATPPHTHPFFSDRVLLMQPTLVSRLRHHQGSAFYFYSETFLFPWGLSPSFFILGVRLYFTIYTLNLEQIRGEEGCQLNCHSESYWAHACFCTGLLLCFVSGFSFTSPAGFLRVSSVPSLDPCHVRIVQLALLTGKSEGEAGGHIRRPSSVLPVAPRQSPDSF